MTTSLQLACCTLHYPCHIHAWGRGCGMSHEGHWSQHSQWDQQSNAILLYGALTRDILAFFIILNIKSVFFSVHWRFLNFSLVWLFYYLYFKFYFSSCKMLHNLQMFQWTRMETTEACSLITLEHNNHVQWTRLGYFKRFPWTRLVTAIIFIIFMRVQWMRLKFVKRVQESRVKYPKHVQRMR